MYSVACEKYNAASTFLFHFTYDCFVNLGILKRTFGNVCGTCTLEEEEEDINEAAELLLDSGSEENALWPLLDEEDDVGRSEINNSFIPAEVGDDGGVRKSIRLPPEHKTSEKIK